MMNLQLYSLVPVAVLLLVFSEIQLTSANKKVPCDKPGASACVEGEYCDSSTGKCTPLPPLDCSTINCISGYICVDRKCIKDTCPHPPKVDCPHGQECYLQPVQCIRAPCPPVQQCRPKACIYDCVKGEVCQNGKCVPDGCTTNTCLTGLLCHKGCCYQEVSCDRVCEKPKKDFPRKCYIRSETCLSSTCPEKLLCNEYDNCATVRCAAGYKCLFGKCVPDNDCL